MDNLTQSLLDSLGIVAVGLNTIHWLWMRRIYPCRFLILPTGKSAWGIGVMFIATILLILLSRLGFVSSGLPRVIARFISQAFLVGACILSIRARHASRPVRE